MACRADRCYAFMIQHSSCKVCLPMESVFVGQDVLTVPGLPTNLLTFWNEPETQLVQKIVMLYKSQQLRIRWPKGGRYVEMLLLKCLKVPRPAFAGLHSLP